MSEEKEDYELSDDELFELYANKDPPEQIKKEIKDFEDRIRRNHRLGVTPSLEWFIPFNI